MASIVIVSGDHRGDRYPLGRRTNVIGRAESLPIQILDDLVSRKHLQIRFEPVMGRYLILDMSSKNGVFLNEARVTGEAFLTDLDRIRIGRTTLVFTDTEAEENTAVLHRFKRAGERQRPTQFIWPVDEQLCETPAPLFIAIAQARPNSPSRFFDIVGLRRGSLGLPQ